VREVNPTMIEKMAVTDKQLGRKKASIGDNLSKKGGKG